MRDRAATRTDADPSATTIDVHIVGTAYSGSTLLGNALNGHPQIAHVGEVSSLPAFGIGPPDDLCQLCYALDRDCPVWNRTTIARLERAGAARSIDVLREVTSAPVVVDSSKWVPWLQVTDPAHRLERRRVQALLSVRHPFAFAASVCPRDEIAPWQAANTWRDTIYDAVRSLARLSIPTLIVRYEEFALDPRPVLERICNCLGLAFDAAMLEFWNTPVHALGGNPGAFVWYPGYVHRALRPNKSTWSERDTPATEVYRQRGFGGWADNRWRSSLDGESRRQIMATPMLADLATLVGYDLSVA